MKKISVIIPCYRSEQTIAGVIEEIINTIAEKTDYDYEIILINDSSPDHVFSVIRQLAENNPKIKGIDLARNFGQHAALMTGFQYTTGDIVVCMDDDGQTPACELFSLVDKLAEGFDVVFAKYTQKKHSIFRNVCSGINDLMARYLIGKPKDLSIMSYFACKRFVIEQVKKYNNPFPYVSGLLLASSDKITNVEIGHRERTQGSSGYTFKKLLSLWLNGFTAFSVKPLRIATMLGCFIAIAGFLYGVYIVVNKFLQPAVPLGYSSIMATLLLIGGCIMLILGLIGEYIGRIYISINNMPQFVIRETINIGQDENGSNEK